MQRDDESLQKFWEKDDVVARGQAKTSFEVKGGVLYRVYKHPYVNGGKPLKQVMVPVQLRSRIMELAHGSIMGGHMGIKKTTDKIQSAFYWPGIQGDVTRYCKSCDVCQKTANKGSVPKVPLEKMPLIDKPFKRVAIDLVGPIVPPSEDGHRYILTFVDFATRYPEAVPLKNIDTETVAEALVDIFSRLGVPEEILSDLGTQFVSECMKEVTRLLSIKQLITTPYHPMCNGLTEKFNGTMKSMLKRLCSEQPRQWHRYINPLLFAYREVPQESTGSSPFELLYGRAVRGPMFILKELWTKELEEPEVKNSYQYVFELREKLEDTLKLAHTELQKAQNKGKHYYDRKTKVRKFVPGEKVLVLLPTVHNKLLMQWKGPFEKLNGDKYFTRIDLSKGYWQISIPEEDIPKTAFVTPDGSYEFLKMPFGMINSAATLKRAIKKLLRGLDNVEFYWDDILVHTRTWEEHIKALRELFRRLLAAGMTVRPTKCLFGVNTVDFLGHRLEEGLIGLHEDNVTKIRDAPRPTTKKQIRSFMGLAGYYRDFIPNFAALAAPLSDLTRKGQPNKVEWGEAQEKAYQSIKALLTKEPVLRLPDSRKVYFLQTDASDSGIGAVLMQMKHDGKLFPVCYASKKLSSAERNYSTIEKECLAIVWGFKRFHLYLYGVPFVLQTDHEPLKYMNSAKFANGRLMRWAMFLQSYNSRVEAIKGSENVGADYLSRVEE